jgi:formylglycine-generating enzyme required for sulfatase activity
MRLLNATLALLLSAIAGCGSRADLQCEQNSNCDLAGGGMCSDPGTGNRWCAYPDGTCPSGYRYSDIQVGDGVSGTCVGGVDAGIDGPGIDGQPGAPGVSCHALPSTCGANGNDNCCNSPMVTGGTHFRSYDLAGDVYSGNQNSPATVSTFRLDKYEVTVGRFRAFVTANQGTRASPPAVGDGTHQDIPGSGWEASWNANLVESTTTLITAVKCDPTFQTWTDAPGSNENRPMNCITWYEAMAFCIWDGGYLPTEAEWDHAATGSDQQRAYPWSIPGGSLSLDTSDASYAVFDAAVGTSCLGDGIPGCAVTDLIEVGTKPAGDGRFGQSDLAGNVREPVLDTYASYVTPCTDCAHLAPGSQIVRGGHFKSIATSDLRTGMRNTGGARTYTDGARCARMP